MNLKLMLSRQEDLQLALGHKLACDLTERERVDAIRATCLALVDETMEALHEARGWKPWSKAEPHVNPEFEGEVIDILTFVLNLILLAFPNCSYGTISRLVEAAYYDKNALNLQRVKEGY